VADIDATLEQQILDLAQRERYRMYIITVRRMTSGELLKYRKGLRIAEGYETPLPGSSQFALTTPSEELELRAEEIRSRLDLARLWAQQGKCQKAHDILSPIDGWFTEGFDTADLKDAKALLDELA